MNAESLKDVIKTELPGLLRDDPALREFILELTQRQYADRVETESRFDRVLAELQRDREEQSRKWEKHQAEQSRKWEEQSRKWERNQAEQSRKWERNQAEQSRKWEEHQAEQSRKWEEQTRLLWQHQEEQRLKWEAQEHKWDEQNRKWDENNAQMREEFKRTHEEIMAVATKQEQNIGALGARWGIQTEQAFRDGLAAIVEKSFGVQVHTINEYDDQGIVFGRPDQVELDVIVKNGVLILCEIKSSMDKAGMYVFGRQAEYYERVHQRKPDRLIVISPWIDGRAKKVAETLGIETYGYSTELKAL